MPAPASLIIQSSMNARWVFLTRGGTPQVVDMPVRIRLARYGHRNHPFYRIYVADSRAPRDGKHLEVVGHYDPKPGSSTDASHPPATPRPTPSDPSRAIDLAPSTDQRVVPIPTEIDGNKHLGLKIDRVK